jgi:hypothetical protein
VTNQPYRTNGRTPQDLRACWTRPATTTYGMRRVGRSRRPILTIETHACGVADCEMHSRVVVTTTIPGEPFDERSFRVAREASRELGVFPGHVLAWLARVSRMAAGRNPAVAT